MPKISFVVPTWNGDAYLAETLETLRKQSLKDIEIIVVDDSSPDFTQELMEWYKTQDVRIKYHRLDVNGGVCDARNYGNKLAKAELICVSDHDDISVTRRASYSYQYFKKHSGNIDCLTSHYWECNVDGIPMKKYTPENMTRELFDSSKFVWFHSSACYRKEDILKIPYRDGNGSTDDWNFLDDWTKDGKKFVTCNKVLANCRRLPGSQMQQRRTSQGMGPSYIL